MKRKTFSGGVHPDGNKELSRECATRDCPAGPELVFPLNQHIGKPAKAVVQKGDRVLVGTVLAEADGFVSAPVVSSCSGTVKAVENRPGVMGLVPAVVVENDEKYALLEGVGKKTDYKKLSRQEILARVQAAGIIGMGGAGFPTHVKLSPKNPDAIEFIIANGAECEPYITCDDRLMREEPEEIVAGLEVLLYLFPKAKGVILMEDNKPEAFAAIEKAAAGHDNVEVVQAETKYPQGGERSVISVVTGRHLKQGMLPADVGCIVDNVATVRAVYRAVCLNEPLVERGFTVTGDGVEKPCNLRVRIGTPLTRVLEEAGGFKKGASPEKLLIGGPMMGIALTGLDASVCRNNNALTVYLKDPVVEAAEQMTECIRCGRCSQVCPLGLVPQMMAEAARKKNYERYEKKLFGLDCVACGSCTFICPARRPLTQLFKLTKAEILAAKKKGGAK